VQKQHKIASDNTTKERKKERSKERQVFQARMLSREKSLLASSCPSVRMYPCGSCWTDFCEIWYWGAFV